MERVFAFTGGTGKKSGGAFTEELSKRIDEIDRIFPGGIRAIVRKSSNTEKLCALLPNADIHAGELKDASFLKQALDGVDTLLHIAGIHQSREVIDAAAAAHVRRVILIHTTGIYSKYKSAGEGYRQIDDYVYKICKENNIILTICRPTMIYGNVYDSNVIVFIRMVDRFPVMPVVNGAHYELQPVHYKDLAKAYYLVLTNENATANKDYNLSGEKPIYLRDMLSIIGRNLGKKTRFISCPFAVAYFGAWVLYLLTFGKKDFREKVQRLCEPRVFSHEQADKDFGYDPVPFETGIVDEVEQYVKQKQ